MPRHGGDVELRRNSADKNLHELPRAREDLLLDNYSWVDESQGKVRIPIERAMELIAQRGLPVARAVEQAPLMTGDQKPVMAVPLTNGFARTDYKLDHAEGVSAARPAKSGQRR